MAETKIDDSTLIMTIEQRQVVTKDKLLERKAALQAELTEVDRLLGILDE